MEELYFETIENTRGLDRSLFFKNEELERIEN